MAIDKTKVAQNAQKLIQKGQLDKAIKEFELLVQADPKDIRSLLKIAELYGKLGQTGESIKAFQKVADQYNKSGFYTKAVAVLRQAIEADKKRVELYSQLADLYIKLGLNKDAILQLNMAAKMLQDEGKHTQALDLLSRMREMDPEDPSVNARYGEALFNAGRKDEAIGIFRTLIGRLKASNNNEDLIKFCERILTINPDDIDALKDLSRAYVKVGLANKALLKLKALFDRNVLDGELYDLLDRSYSLLGKEDKAIHAQVEKAKFLLTQGKSEEARRSYENVLSRDPENHDALAYLRPSRRPMPPAPPVARPAAAPTPRPSAPAAPVRAAAPAAGAGPNTASKQLSKFLTEADVYLKYGLRDKALEQLENVLQHDPNNIAARKKLVDIYTEDNPQKAVVHLKALAEISEGLGEMDQAMAYWAKVKAIEPDADADVGAEVVGLSEEEIESESGFLDENEIDVSAEETEIEIDTAEAEGEAEVEVEVEEVGLLGADEDEAGAEDFGSIGAGMEDELGDFLEDEKPAAKKKDEVIDFDSAGPDVNEELDEAEFYLQQNIFPEALEIYERIIEKHPGHPAAMEKLAYVKAQMGEAAPAQPAAAAKPAAKPAPAASDDEPLFDLAAELEEELDFGEEAQAAAAEEEPPSFEDIFSQFKKGVERELKDDAGAHYDLGIAYKEMGLVKDAVGEFEIAMKNPERLVECCNMIAICYQELGENQKAVDYYLKGLEAPGCPPEAALNMEYEIACVYEALGDIRNAAQHFKKVVDQDKTYRDVGERIRALKARVQAGKAFA